MFNILQFVIDQCRYVMFFLKLLTLCRFKLVNSVFSLKYSELIFNSSNLLINSPFWSSMFCTLCLKCRSLYFDSAITQSARPFTDTNKSRRNDFKLLELWRYRKYSNKWWCREHHIAGWYSSTSQSCSYLSLFEHFLGPKLKHSDRLFLDGRGYSTTSCHQSPDETVDSVSKLTDTETNVY